MPICYDFFGTEICFPTLDDITNTIESWFEDFWKTQQSWFMEQFSSLYSEIVSGVVTPIESYIHDFASDLLSDFANVLSPLFQPIIGWFESLTKTISSIPSILQQYSDILQNIPLYITQPWLLILDVLQQMGVDLPAPLIELKDAITKGYEGLITSIAQLPETIQKLPDRAVDVAYALVDAFMKTANEFWNELVKIAMSIADTITDSFEFFVQFLVDLGSKFSAILQDILLAPIQEAALDRFHGRMGTPWDFVATYGWSVFLTELFYGAMRGIMELEPGIDIVKTEARVQAYFLILNVFNTVEVTVRKLDEYLYQIHLEIGIPPGSKVWYRLVGLRYFARIVRNLYWNLGFGWLTWSIFGPFMQQIIAEPYRRYVRQKHLTEEPTLSVIMENWRRGFITTAEAKKLLFYYGYPEEWHSFILRANAYYPPPSEILDWYHRGLIDRDTAREYLRQYGISELYIDNYIENSYYIPSVSNILEAYNRKLIDERTTLHYLLMHRYHVQDAELLMKLSKQELSRTIVEELYVRGIINKEQFVDMLERLGYTKEQIELIEQTLEYLPSRSQIEEWYVRGFISEEQAKQMLRQLGYSEQTIELILKSTKNELSYSNLFELYEWGTITQDELLERLQKLGYRDKELVLMQELARIRAISDELSQIRTRVGNLYADGVLTREDAKDILMKLGYPEEQVDLYLDAKNYSRMSDVISDYVSAVLIEFRDGKIDEATCRLMLAPYIKDPERIESMIALYRSLRMKEPAFILPPIFKDRAEYIRSVIESLRKQVEHIQKTVDMLEEEYNFLIGRLQQYKAQAPPELQESLDRQIQILEESKQLREQYYGTLLFQLYLYLSIYQELLQKYGGAM